MSIQYNCYLCWITQIRIFYTAINVPIFTDDLHNIMSTVNSTYCYTQCDIKTTNLPHTYLTHFTTTNNNCTTFISTEQYWKVILTVTYCLQSADSQHSHCCCWPTNTLTSVHYTNSTTFVSPSAELKALCTAVALNTSQLATPAALVQGR